MPIRGAARFREPARFEVRSGDADRFGNPDTRWMWYGDRPVELVQTPANESLEGGVLQSHTRARLRVRKDAALVALPTDARVKVRGRYWSIVSLADLTWTEPQNRNVLEFTVDAGVAT